MIHGIVNTLFNLWFNKSITVILSWYTKLTTNVTSASLVLGEVNSGQSKQTENLKKSYEHK